MNKFLPTVFVAFAMLATSAHANWVCNVNDNKDHQYSFSAPEEDDAEKISEAVCKTFGIKEKDCTPDCFDTGITTSRWHCVVHNQKWESWSFITPAKQQAEKLAQSVCSSHKIAKKDCKPVCVPE